MRLICLTDKQSSSTSSKNYTHLNQWLKNQILQPIQNEIMNKQIYKYKNYSFHTTYLLYKRFVTPQHIYETDDIYKQQDI